MPRLVMVLLLAAVPILAESELASGIDRGANPCVDFHQYACGGWYQKNPMPVDRTRWGQYEQLRDRTQNVLKELLETAASHPKDAIDRQIGDYYASCVDEDHIDELGLEPLKIHLQRISKISKREELPGIMADLHSLGVNALFHFGSMPDMKHASDRIAYVDQGGLTLPDRDYYMKADSRSKELLSKYAAHLEQVFKLLGFNAETAAAKGKNVLEFETALARGSLDRVSRRDPRNLDHKMSLPELQALAPSVDWQRYFSATGAPRFESLNVDVPAFVKQIEVQLSSAPLPAWRDYLTWRYVSERADMLPKAFREARFEFMGRTLTGAQQEAPRWRRCAAMIDKDLGEALGRKYAEKYFTADTKAEVLRLVHQVEKTFEKDVNSLEWMSPETKKRALEKLQRLTNKIGYPDRWRDYSSLHVHRRRAFANLEAGLHFERKHDWEKIGKHSDKSEWRMTPPTVNAYYDGFGNSINFPAARLQPPFYHPGGDLAANYGGIAAVIGHELTHGFDDQGRKRDGGGNLADWWTPEDGRAFEERTQCFVDQYAAYTAIGDIHVNGKLTLGENTADNGGVRLAYMALGEALADKPKEVVDGLTPEQRFFVAYAHTRCDSGTEESARLRALTDPHSPGKYRINGVVSNMPEFWKAFGCTEGQPMVRERACRVW